MPLLEVHGAGFMLANGWYRFDDTPPKASTGGVGVRFLQLNGTCTIQQKSGKGQGAREWFLDCLDTPRPTTKYFGSNCAPAAHDTTSPALVASGAATPVGCKWSSHHIGANRLQPIPAVRWPLVPLADCSQVRRRRVVLLGGIGRHNFGDLLMAHVLEALLISSGYVRRSELVFADLLGANMTADGGHESQPITDVLRGLLVDERVDVITVGGEVFTCSLDMASSMFRVCGSGKCSRGALVAKCSNTLPHAILAARGYLGPEENQLAYLPSKAAVACPGVFIANAAGGYFNDNRTSQAYRAAHQRLLSYDYVSTRDHHGFVGLRETLGLARARLVPDSVLALRAIPALARRVRRAAAGARSFTALRLACSLRGGACAGNRTASAAMLLHDTLRVSMPPAYIAVQIRSLAVCRAGGALTVASSLCRVQQRQGLPIVFYRAGSATGHDSLHAYALIAAELERLQCLGASRSWMTAGGTGRRMRSTDPDSAAAALESAASPAAAAAESGAAGGSRHGGGGSTYLFDGTDIFAITAVIAHASLSLASSLHCRILAISYGIPRVSAWNGGEKDVKVTRFIETWELPTIAEHTVVYGWPRRGEHDSNGTLRDDSTTARSSVTSVLDVAQGAQSQLPAALIVSVAGNNKASASTTEWQPHAPVEGNLTLSWSDRLEAAAAWAVGPIGAPLMRNLSHADELARLYMASVQDWVPLLALPGQ